MEHCEDFPFGHDYGNSETCQVVIGRGVHTHTKIPSITALGTWKDVELAAAGAGRSVREYLRGNHFVLEYDRAEESGTRRVSKVIGQKVFDDGATPLETLGDSSRYSLNGYNLEMLMVGSGSLIPDEEYGLHVVTGLPINTYTPQAVAQVQKALQGTHLYWLNGRQRLLHVQSVKVIMEGAGALIANGSTDDVLQGVIDIGGKTTDLFVGRGQRPLAELRKGAPMGVAKAADRFIKRFQEEYGRTLGLEARMSLLRAHVARTPYPPILDSTGARVDERGLAKLLEESLRAVGQDIATFAAATWGERLMDITKILIVGGGAHYFAKDIQERMRQAVTTPHPELANAQGYASLAEAIAERARLAR